MKLNDVGLLLTLGTLLGCSPGVAGTGGFGESSDGSSGMTGTGEIEPPPESTATSGLPTETSSSSTSADSSTGELEEPKLDVGEFPDLGVRVCGQGEVTASHIWIPNTGDDTIVKIDTQTLEHVAWYATMDAPNTPNGHHPAGTSVSLNGDAAITTTFGNVMKVHTRLDDCVESNGIPGIQTSVGENDALPFGDDECLAWATSFDCVNSRATAWTSGNFDDRTCSYQDEELWVSCDRVSPDPALTSQNLVYRLDGQTGAVVETVEYTGALALLNIAGGAVDSDNDFWVLSEYNQPAVFEVDYETLEVREFAVPGSAVQGISIDENDNIWVCGGSTLHRLDPQTATWTTDNYSSSIGGVGGCATDANGNIWTGAISDQEADWNIVAVDIETMEVADTAQLPNLVAGISVDVHGYVWGNSFASDSAWRLDPQTDEIETVSGLNQAWGYSDMTGFALASVQPEG